MHPLRGIIPPLVTPLREQDKLDVEHLEKLIDYVVHAHVHGVFLLGTTGEGPSLSHRLKQELIREACRLMAGRVPVLVNISDTALSESLSLAYVAADAGANALVATAPYYFPLDQENLWQYLRHLVSDLPLPLFLYNMPSHTKAAFGTETLARALHLKQVFGIKDSSGDRSYLLYLIEQARQRPDWSVLVGPEELLVEGLQAGAHGAVPGGGNLYPRLVVELFEAIRDDDRAGLPGLQDRLHWFHQHVFRAASGPNGWLVGLKAAMALQGLCRETTAEPLHALSDSQREHLRRAWTRLRSEGEF
jgi:4-hydroxy-tetrahydrodipicolinate synthase